VYEFTLGSTTDVEQSPPLKCVLGKPFYTAAILLIKKLTQDNALLLG